MARPSKLAMVKMMAEIYAQQSTCSRRAMVGAVLFDDDYRVVAGGYNGAPQGFPHCDAVGCVTDALGSCIMAVHAEMNAILQCAVYGVSTRGLNLYVTLEPCNRCAVVIARAGIKTVIYGAKYHRNTEGVSILRGAGIEVATFETGGNLAI